MTVKLSWLTKTPVAHRGYHDMNHSIWENTLSAFQRAVDAGYAIECDLQLSSDSVPVVFHDDDMERLTGLKGDVREKTSAELSLISIGKTKDRVPTLKQLLKLCAGRVPLVIELKGRSGEDVDYGFVEAVLDELSSYQGNVALMSFDHHLLRDLKTAKSPWPIGLTAEGKTEREFNIHAEALALGVDFISYHYGDLPNPLIDAQRKLGMPVITWTVRDQAGMDITYANADQITFEGFDPKEAQAAIA